ncbi:MAG: hypothetical protein K9M56_04360 [Victivallales bacterium]|nr:hypothetical protein [Victivallales bacterium]
MNHSFDVELATKIGLGESIVLQHIFFWYQRNKANNKNYHSGTWWSYNSLKAFEEIFPYLTQKQIRNTLFKLEKGGYIKTGEFNQIKFDRTKWYTLTDFGLKLLESFCYAQSDTFDLSKGQMSIVERATLNCPKGKPIPDNNTDIKTDNKKRGKNSRFSSPSVSEIKIYCKERENNIDPERFYDFYQSKNWMVGSSKMKDWKAAVRNWERRNRDYSNSPEKNTDKNSDYESEVEKLKSTAV